MLKLQAALSLPQPINTGFFAQSSLHRALLVAERHDWTYTAQNAAKFMFFSGTFGDFRKDKTFSHVHFLRICPGELLRNLSCSVIFAFLFTEMGAC